jgi:hypothetical protein
VFSEGSDLTKVGSLVFESPICNYHDNDFSGATRGGTDREPSHDEKAMSNSNDVFTSIYSVQQSMQILPLPQPPLLAIFSSRLFGPQVQA